MESEQAQPERPAPDGPATDAVTWAAQVEAAWAEGATGWDRLGAAWGVLADSAAPEPDQTAPEPCWWDAPPWCGDIPDADFRAIVAAYVARHGSYSPALPEREPGVLRDWLRAHGYASLAAPPAAA
jgi:hypothetical protein